MNESGRRGGELRIQSLLGAFEMRAMLLRKPFDKANWSNLDSVRNAASRARWKLTTIMATERRTGWMLSGCAHHVTKGNTLKVRRAKA